MSSPLLKGEHEHRSFKTKLRTSGYGTNLKLIGYAAVFNQTTDLGAFREKIAPGAFTRAINERQDCRCLFNHSADCVLGRTKNGTLRLSQDSTGLKIDCDLPETQTARDLHALIARGDIDQMSFGFIVRDEDVVYGNDGDMLRTIKDLDLLDVSPCTFAAYQTTSVEARSVDAAYQIYRREAIARTAGPPDSELQRMRRYVRELLASCK